MAAHRNVTVVPTSSFQPILTSPPGGNTGAGAAGMAIEMTVVMAMVMVKEIFDQTATLERRGRTVAFAGGSRRI